jgi:hypothetical protein
MFFENDDFDMYLFLVSSDWCSPFLSVVIEVDMRDMNKIKDACRKGVMHAMKTAPDALNFYEMDFSKERKKATWEIVAKSLSSSSLLNKIERLAGQKEVDDENDILSTFWLFIEDEYLHVEQNSLETSIHDNKLVLSQVVKSIAEEDNSLYEKEALLAKTDWDKFLISTTPEMPTALSDFFTVKVIQKSNFKNFWSRAISILGDKELKGILDDLTKRYEDLTEQSAILPSWLSSI